MIDYSKFTKEEIEKLKEDYVLNECGTDEYRETQPGKGIRHINRAIKLLEEDEGSAEKVVELLRLMRDWTRAIGERGYDKGYDKGYGGGYEGDQELKPALRMVFDILVEKGQHPYNCSEEDLRDRLTW